VTNAFGTLRVDALAKGKLTVRQTEQLLEWYDLGIKGQLPLHHDQNTFIDKDVFARSLKIMVMHHYLFENQDNKSNYFMRVHHRDVVFRNVALAAFDVLLCGHKHCPAFDVHSYGQHFDSRAKQRYLVNQFRRLIGLHSLPIQFTDDTGVKWSKSLTRLVQLIAWITKRETGQTGDHEIADEVIQQLKQGLHDPKTIERRVKGFMRQTGVIGKVILTDSELTEIRKRLSIGLSADERKLLRPLADKISAVARTLKSTDFLQSISGSSAKASRNSNAKRTFSIYRIRQAGNQWLFESEEFEWSAQDKTFGDCPVRREHTFRPRI